MITWDNRIPYQITWFVCELMHTLGDRWYLKYLVLSPVGDLN